MSWLMKYTLIFSIAALAMAASYSPTVACWFKRHIVAVRLSGLLRGSDASAGCRDQARRPGTAATGFTPEDIAKMKAAGLGDDVIAKYAKDGAGHADVEETHQGQQGRGVHCRTINEKMKAIGLTQKQIDDYANQKAGHNDVEDIIKANKVTAFTPEDIKKLMDAGATETDIKQWTKDRRGHEDMEEILKVLNKKEHFLPQEGGCSF